MMKIPATGAITAILPLYAVSFVSHLAPYIYIPSLPDIADAFGIADSEAGAMMSTYYMSLSITLLVIGTIGDRWDKRKTLG